MVKSAEARVCRLFSRSQVEALLDLDSAIAAVEEGFRRLGAGDPPASGVLGLHPPGGGFHLKAAVFPGGAAGRLYLAAKLNANFPGNPVQHGLPTIQGLVELFDAADGVPLAVLDSTAITILRTAAATAVAVKHLARPDVTTLAIVGCGAQARAQVAAVSRVRRLSRVLVCDVDRTAAERFAERMSEELAIGVTVASDVHSASCASDVIITCTPAGAPILTAADVRPGSMVAAVGADSEHKSELEPALLAAARVVCDDRDQCARIGDLHHALAAGVMTIGAVGPDLGEIVAGVGSVGPAASDIVVFDSTGLPFQDVVASAIVFERGVERGVGLPFAFRD